MVKVRLAQAKARPRVPLRPLQRFRSKMPAWRRSSAALLRAARNEER